MTPQRIQRQRTPGWRAPLCTCGCGQPARYVGRPTKWGNPFTVEEHGLKLSLALYRNVINGLWSPLLLDHLGDQPYVRNYEAMQRMRGRLQNHPKEVAWCELRTHKPEPSRTAATANATAQEVFPARRVHQVLPLLAGQVIPSPVGARRIAAALLSAAATAEEAGA